MKVFVTGGAGFIGSNFIRQALAQFRDLEIVNYDKLTYAGNLDNLRSVEGDPRYSFRRGDICDRQATEQAMSGCAVVVHFAAESHVDRSIHEPSVAVMTNVVGTANLLETARVLKIRRFIHVSTDEVYGDLAANECAAENAPIKPSSPYAATKAASDMLVLSYVRTYGFPAIITRASNNYGPYQFPEKFFPLMISNAMEMKPLPVYGDGQQERDWLHVSDHCSALLLVLQKGEDGEIYNIGGGNVYRNLMLVKEILRTLNKPESLLEFVKDRPGHDRRYALDCTKLRSKLGWNPQVELSKGVKDTADWYLSNKEWLDSVRSGQYQEYYQIHYDRREETFSSFRAAPR